MKLAEQGIAELQKHVDTLIIIPNQNLFRIANEKTTFSDAFRMADEVLQSGVRGVTDLMVMPGLINLDFADIRAVMAEMGKAMMGTGEAVGERRAVEAAEAAISNPLLDDISMKGARGVLINITGGLDMTLFEVDEAANRIRDEVDPDANIIFGSTFDESMQGKMRVSVVATGIEANVNTQARPLHLASQGVEPSRRPNVSSNRPVSAGMAGGYGYEKTSARQEFGASGSSGGIPSSILPPAQPAHMMQPSMSHTSNPVMSASRPVTSQRTMERSPEPQVTVGHASSATWAPEAATARKWDDADITVEDTYTKPAQTQTIQRPTARSAPETSAGAFAPPVRHPVSSPVAQPRAQRHGNSFIPPKPVDPKAASGGSDLFGDAPMAAPRVPTAEKPVKKSPSLFERFTMQRSEEAPSAAPARAELLPKLSVEDGGKLDEDELDIPAFLRRQAN
jgi:cell division protein FtsZ